MKIGIYYAYWANNWNVDFHPFIDKASDIGFDVIELNAGTITLMTKEDRKSIKSHADDRGIELSYVVGLQSQYDISSENLSTRKSGINFLQQMSEAIGEIGGGPVGGIIYGSWPASLPQNEHDKRPYVDRSIESMKEAIKSAEDNNVFFNMEVVNRFEQFIMNTCEEAIDYVKTIDSKNAKIMLDTFHINIEEDFFKESIVRANNYLGHFHIGENNRMPPGYGHIPWKEVADGLKKIAYQGYIVMEPFLMPGGEVGRDIKVYRNLAKGLDIDTEAAKALEFTRKVFQ
tara:strand:- start:2278 stop:3138 length:861 start_codon:yes stop_codon:yes gene_type:complete